LAEGDAHAMLSGVGGEDEIVVRFLVQPPAVDIVPGRMWIACARGALARRRLLVRQLGKCRRRKRLCRHGAARAEEIGSVPLDEPRIQLGVSECRAFAYAA